MNLFNTNKGNLDEVVFEQRNKAYGAYAIRKSYPDHVNRGMLLTIAPLLFIVIGGIAWNYFWPLPKIIFHQGPPTTDITPTERIVVHEKFRFEIQKMNVVPKYKVVPNKQASRPIADFDETRPPVIGDPNALSTTTTTPATVGTVPGPLVIDPPPVEPAIKDWVDHMPEFPGGEKAMFDYINRNIHYPDIAITNGIEGKVLISFVIMPDGTVQMWKVERSIGFGCDDEALRVVKEMPAWKAGSQNGHNVPVRLLLPVVFRTN